MIRETISILPGLNSTSTQVEGLLAGQIASLSLTALGGIAYILAYLYNIDGSTGIPLAIGGTLYHFSIVFLTILNLFDEKKPVIGISLTSLLKLSLQLLQIQENSEIFTIANQLFAAGDLLRLAMGFMAVAVHTWIGVSFVVWIQEALEYSDARLLKDRAAQYLRHDKIK